MAERSEMRPTYLGGTPIPDPHKVPNYQSPYPEGDFMEQTLLGSGNGRKIHPCAPKDYDGPVAPNGWPIGVVKARLPY